MSTPQSNKQSDDDFTTVDVAKLLGLAVRSVQLMVDRGELQAWKTPGGHRRISRASVEAVLKRRGLESHGERTSAPERRQDKTKVLLIEDSVHYQNLVTLLIRQQFPQVELHVASDGIAGLALYGRLDPDILLVDILLPGIDGAALITSLRSQPQFADCQLMVVTSLDETQREPYAYALRDLPVIHKARLVAELPPQLAHCLAERQRK